MHCIECGVEITNKNMIDPELEVCSDCFLLEEAIQGDNVDDFYNRQIDDDFLDEFLESIYEAENTFE